MLLISSRLLFSPLRCFVVGKLNFANLISSSGLELDPRQLICEQLQSPNSLSSSLSFRVELLNRFDTCLVCRFGNQNIRIAQPLAVSLNAPADDLEVHYFEMCKRSVNSGCSVIAFCNNEDSYTGGSSIQKPPAGIVLCSTQHVSGQECRKLKEFEFRRDYSDVIESAGYLRRNASRVHILLQQLQSQVLRFVPLDVDKVGSVENFCIRPSYNGLDLENSLIKESMKLLHFQGVQYVSAICVTDSQRAIFAKLGFTNHLEFPLANFNDGDHSVFKQLPNEKDSSRLSLMISKLE